MTKDEALNIAIDYMNERLEEHDAKFQRHPATEAERNNILADIETVKEALAQPKQEPVVWMYQNKSTHEVRFQKYMRSFVDHGAWYEVPLYSEPLANHELQCVCGAVWCGDEMVHLPNKAQPQRKPLSDEEIILIVAECASSHQHTDIHFARAIERAHGIKELV